VITPNGSKPAIVDSSGWLEYLTDDVNASRFAPYIERESPLVLPSIVVYEVYKKLLHDNLRTVADRFVSQAMRHNIVPLDERLALSAAHLSLDHRLAMADAIIYATAQSQQATLVTGDLHFRNLPGVIIP
jgi:predicted nucleic acid-binding protein